MSDIVEFLNAQYDRIEERERGRRTIRAMAFRPCPICGRPFGEWSGSYGDQGEATFQPCGHSIPIADFYERFGESSADPFVLADIESKRRILNEVVDEATSLDMQVDGEFRAGTRDEDAEPYIGDKLLHLLAAPFSGEPGYDKRWAE